MHQLISTNLKNENTLFAQYVHENVKRNMGNFFLFFFHLMGKRSAKRAERQWKQRLTLFIG